MALGEPCTEQPEADERADARREERRDPDGLHGI
jgi:hypothetical protein